VGVQIKIKALIAQPKFLIGKTQAQITLPPPPLPRGTAQNFKFLVENVMQKNVLQQCSIQ